MEVRGHGIVPVGGHGIPEQMIFLPELSPHTEHKKVSFLRRAGIRAHVNGDTGNYNKGSGDFKVFLMILPCTNRKDVVIYMYAGSCGSIRTHGNKNKRSRRTKDGIADHGLHCLFAGAKQAVQELEQLRERELCLEESEKTLEDQLRTREKAVADTIARTVKARGEEIARSYDTEIGKTEDQLKKVKAKREKARNQGVKGRIAEDTQSLSKENEELKGRIRTLFRANHVPGYCAGGLYYSLYFTRGLKEMGILLLALLIFFLAVPCGIYFAVPERKIWYLILIYLADIPIFGGVYVKIGNSTKMKHMDALREGRSIRNRIQANKKADESHCKDHPQR